MSPHTHAVEQEFESPQPVTATVRNGSGFVTVIAEDRPVTAVAVDPCDDTEASRAAAQQTSVTFTGDRLTVETQHNSASRIFRRGGRVRITVRLPLGSRVWNQVGSADVRIEGQLAEATVNSGSGDVYATEVASLNVDTGSGDLRAERIGALRVSTGSGDVSVTNTTGEVMVKTASGDVHIDEAGGPVRTSTASGDVRIGAAHGDRVQVNTASGDVEVGVPAGTRVWLDLITASGSTRNDLAMADPHAPAPAENGAQLNLEIRTASGDIAVRRVTRRAK
jgi:DUF4097 and DUF4098 domain-containing protein YvlB